MRPYFRGLLVNIAHMGKDGLRPKRTGYLPGKGAGRFAFRSRFALRSPQTRTSGLPRVVQGLSGKRHAAMRCHCGHRKEAVAGLAAAASKFEIRLSALPIEYGAGLTGLDARGEAQIA
jgi:hypothetical protein